jgi:DNA-binding NarL/FixJ family response regulator
MKFVSSGSLARFVRSVDAAPIEARRPFVSASDESVAASRRALGQFRILIAEDDFLIAFDLETALTNAGFNVVGVAVTADEAIALAASHAPSIVIMDIRLAGKRDGIDAALELFREHGIRCVFASAHSDEDARRRAAPAKPLGWIEKPYSVAAVVGFITRVVSGKP